MLKDVFNCKAVCISRRKDDGTWFVYAKGKGSLLYSGHRMDVAVKVAMNERDLVEARAHNRGVRL